MSNLINTRRLLNSNNLNDQGIINNYKNTPLVDFEFTRKAYGIIEENIDNSSFEVSDFVKAIGMSRAQLYRKINGVSGLSVKEFIRIIRLKKAAVMLTQTHYNISEIAYKVGFNSIAYFTRSFGQYYGLTPSKYKKLPMIKTSEVS